MKSNKIITALLLYSISTMAISAEPFEPASVANSTPEREHAIQLLRESFQRRIGDSEIKQCSLVVEEPFAHFSAVGGLCDVSIGGKTAQWMICADYGVGNFAAVVGARWWQNPDSYLTQFLESNCIGG